MLTDVPASGADFWVCSPYKFLGPHHGVLAARPALLETLHPAKLLPSSDAVPERFELGTLPYELLAGTTAAVDFLADLALTDPSRPRRERLEASFAALEEHEDALLAALEERLRAIPGLTAYSNAKRRTPTLLVTVEGHDPQDLRAPSRSVASTRRPATSTHGSAATTSGSARPVGCGWVSRRTRTPTTSTGSRPASRRSAGRAG